MTARPVTLTSHPLQRIGAYALAALAGAAEPAEMTQAEFDTAAAAMADDVAAAADDVAGPGSFWLAVSYMMWPNSAVNPSARGKQSVRERREKIACWRTYPADSLRVPCALCGRPGCGFYGKVDVPLGASACQRNTTAPGHEGLPLCRACLASFHALPYGCALGGGRAAALHSWDDDFLRSSVQAQVRRTRQKALAGSLAGRARIPYAREVAVLRGLGGYAREVREGVDLYVFSNSNREQVLEVQSLGQPLAEWLRQVARNPQRREGLRYLVRAHWTAKIPGTSLLARNAFRDPLRIIGASRAYLSGLAAEQGAPPPETTALTRLCVSFATEALGAEEHDVRQIGELGGRIAVLLARRPVRATVTRYEHAHRSPRQLQAWLRRNGVSWLLEPGQQEPLVTARQWQLLFEPDGETCFWRDLLLMTVLEALAADGSFAGATDELGARADKEDSELCTEEAAEQ